MVLFAMMTTLAHAAGVDGSEYRSAGRCGPFARADVSTPSWLCVGIVAGPGHGLVWPRSILQVANNRFIVTDMLAWWARRKGRILALSIGEDGGVVVDTLFADRNLPHGLALGPDGRVYVGDDDKIWRFDPRDAAPKPETLIAGLPDKMSRGGDHLHPLKQLAFDREGNLIVNMGAPNDSCKTVVGVKQQWPYPCPYSDGARPDAALWRLKFEWPAGKPGEFLPLARGLRNTVALAVHPVSGLVFQGENAMDRWGGRTEPAEPPDELNIVMPGRHYGWPYCAGFATVVPEYRGRIKTCSQYERPYMLLPAHSAPLGLLFYSGEMFPELKGKLLIAFHGYRENGHRIVAYDADTEGKPLLLQGPGSAPLRPTEVVSGWGRSPGIRPIGSPVGPTQASNGAIWFVDDKARTVMVLLRSEESDRDRRDRPRPPEAAVKGTSPPGWASFFQSTLRPRCGECHDEFREADPAAGWNKAVASGFADPLAFKDSPMIRRMRGEGPGVPMPLPDGLKRYPMDFVRLEAFLASLSSKRPSQ